MLINLTLKSWISTSTRDVTQMRRNHYRLNLTTPQPPVTRRVSASRSLGSIVTWARAITTSPTDVTWGRSLLPRPLVPWPSNCTLHFCHDDGLSCDCVLVSNKCTTSFQLLCVVYFRIRRKWASACKWWWWWWWRSLFLHKIKSTYLMLQYLGNKKVYI